MHLQHKTIIRLIAVVAALLIVGWLWTLLPLADWINAFRIWILSLGIIGVSVFVALYILVTMILGPATALTLTAGLAYGFWGFPLVIGSATVAASLAFLLGRYLMHERVNRWLDKDARLRALNEAVSLEGWRVVGLLRLSPIIPYGLQNYLFSVTHIRFVPYVVATMIGIMPATALYVYIGSLGQSIGQAGALQWLVAGAGLAATAAVAWVVGKHARAVLADKSLHTTENFIDD